MKNKGKLMFFTLLMALLCGAFMCGCGGGSGSSAPSGNGTLSGSAK